MIFSRRVFLIETRKKIIGGLWATRQNQDNGSVCAINQFFDKYYRDQTCTLNLTK